MRVLLHRDVLWQDAGRERQLLTGEVHEIAAHVARGWIAQGIATLDEETKALSGAPENKAMRSGRRSA
jgi:hypothetical protein